MNLAYRSPRRSRVESLATRVVVVLAAASAGATLISQPAPAVVSAVPVPATAALSDPVDWSRVEAAPADTGASIGAYD